MPRTATPRGFCSVPGGTISAPLPPDGVEAHDAVVAGVDDVQHATRGGEAATGRRVVATAGAEVELAQRRAGAAPAADQPAGRVEAHDPVGATVGDDDLVVAGDRDGTHGAELAGARAGRADVAQPGAVGRELLDDVRPLVGDVHHAVGSDGDRLREAQDATAALAVLAQSGVRAVRRRRAGAIGLGGRGGGRHEGSGEQQRGEEAAHRHLGTP